MISYVFIAFGIIIPLVSLIVKRRTVTTTTLAVVAIVVALAALLASFVPRQEYNTATGEFDYHENVALNTLTLLGSLLSLVLGVLSIAITPKAANNIGISK